MLLEHSDRVFFDPTSHSYLMDGEVLLMGVTELMRKHNLSADYSGIRKDVLEKAARLGTELHREIQDYENGISFFASELIDEYKKLGLKFIESEYQVSDFELVASAIDMVYESGKDTVMLCDIKATEKYHRRSLEWQLGIYKYLFERQNPGIKVDSLRCLHIDKKTRTIKGFYPVDGVSTEEVEALLDAERNGLIYIDEKAVPDAALVLNDAELVTYVSKASEIAKLKEAVKQIEAALKSYDEKILAYMDENNLTEMAAPGGVFKKKASYSRTSVDSAKLQKLFPAVYEKVTKTSTVSASVSFKPSE